MGAVVPPLRRVVDQARNVTVKGRQQFIELNQGWATGFSNGQITSPRFLDAGASTVMLYAANAPDTDFRVAAYPTKDDSFEPVNFAGGSALVVPSTAAHPEEALDFTRKAKADGQTRETFIKTAAPLPRFDGGAGPQAERPLAAGRSHLPALQLG